MVESSPPEMAIRPILYKTSHPRFDSSGAVGGGQPYASVCLELTPVEETSDRPPLESRLSSHGRQRAGVLSSAKTYARGADSHAQEDHTDTVAKLHPALLRRLEQAHRPATACPSSWPTWLRCRRPGTGGVIRRLITASPAARTTRGGRPLRTSLLR